MRDGWSRRASYAVIDCGPHGALTCGHAHADALAFDLVARGCPFLTDSGTYTYTGSLEERNYFRSSAAHNTVTVDGESSSVPASTFRWSHIANSRLTAWVTRPRIDYFEGAHDGYERLVEPATHRRSVFFLKNDYWMLRDRIESSGFHRVAIHFHCTPDVRVRVDGDHQLTLTSVDASGGETALGITSFAPGATFACESEWVSPFYAKRERALACVLRTEGEGHQEVVTFLLPHDDGASPPRVREIKASRGRAFVIDSDDICDTLLVGARGGSIAADVAADAEWAWVRRSASGEVLEFVVLAGRALSVSGTTIFRAEDAAEYVASQIAHGGSIESNDPCAVSAE
jgi:hypothetical protein